VFTAGEARNAKLKYYYFDLQTRLNAIKSFISRKDNTKALD